MRRMNVPLVLSTAVLVLGAGALLCACGGGASPPEAAGSAELDAVPAAEPPEAADPGGTVPPETEPPFRTAANEPPAEPPQGSGPAPRPPRGRDPDAAAVGPAESAPRPPVFGPAPAALPEPPAPAEEPPRPLWVTLPAATGLEVEVREALSSETSRVGDPVSALVIRHVIHDGLIVVPAGSELFGAVSAAQRGRRIGGRSALSVDFERLKLPSGEAIAVRAFLDAEGRKQTKKDAATIGGATAGGAILGRILSDKDRGKGTAIGAILGAAAGAAVASRNAGDPVIVESGAVTEVRLETPVRVAIWNYPAPATVAETR